MTIQEIPCEKVKPQKIVSLTFKKPDSCKDCRLKFFNVYGYLYCCAALGLNRILNANVIAEFCPLVEVEE